MVSPLLTWFSGNARDLPWRYTLDPYAVWVSEIMLQQTQVKTVIPYFQRWMRELPDIASLANSSSEKIHKLWEGLGYYTRVRNMQKAACVIVEKHGGNFPTHFDDVLALPGIGPYTAGAICSIAFNQPTPILDGNVVRVLTRLFGIREDARAKETSTRLWSLADKLVGVAMKSPAFAQPGKRLNVRAGSSHYDSFQISGACSALNQALMELGATVCTSTQPNCNLCPIARLCVARRDGLTGQLPHLGDRVASTLRRFAACVIERDGAVLVRRRPEGGVNAHLWEFPNVEVALKSSRAVAQVGLETELGCALDILAPLVTVKHTITRYRMTLEAFRGRLKTMPRQASGLWIPIGQVERLPFTSAHRQVLLATLQDAGSTL